MHIDECRKKKYQITIKQFAWPSDFRIFYVNTEKKNTNDVTNACINKQSTNPVPFSACQWKELKRIQIVSLAN